VIGVVAGQTTRWTRVAVALILAATMSIPDFGGLSDRMANEPHPLRTTRDCIASVERPNYYYFRKLGWEEWVRLPEDEAIKRATDPAEPRPVLMPENIFTSFRWPSPPAHADISDLMVVLLPRPYKRCAF
jgi:hypothetical protein